MGLGLLIWLGGSHGYLYGQSGAPTAKDRQLERWARELVRLRAEVDVLANKVKLERTQSLLSLRSLALRQQQLELQADSDALRLRALKDKAGRLQQRSVTQKNRQKALVRLLKSLLSSTQKVIQQTLPFRRKERVQRVARIQQQLQAGQLDVSQAATRLWRILSDELRLGTLVERTEVPVQLPNETQPRLMQAVRLGSYALFVKHPKGSWGRIVHTGATWTYEAIVGNEAQHELEKLYHDLERQKRDGFYKLPLGPQPGAKR